MLKDSIPRSYGGLFLVGHVFKEARQGRFPVAFKFLEEDPHFIGTVWIGFMEHFTSDDSSAGDDVLRGVRQFQEALNRLDQGEGPFGVGGYTQKAQVPRDAADLLPIVFEKKRETNPRTCPKTPVRTSKGRQTLTLSWRDAPFQRNASVVVGFSVFEAEP